MELYYVISVTDRDKAENLIALYESFGLQNTLTKLGRGTASWEHLDLNGLEATEKAIISTAAGAEDAAQLLKAARRRLRMDIPGNGIMMTVPIKSVAGGLTLSYLAYMTKSEVKGGKPEMKFEYELIIVILNEGYADFVMDAARSAGDGGGTVLHAKGTGGKRQDRFFSVSLADEKDMIYIVAHSDEKAAIMKAIHDQAGPASKAGAISFSLPISSVVGLRARDVD